MWILPLVLLVAFAAAAAGQAPVTIGAIRWDAWHGDRGEPGKAVTRSLSPNKWHHRLPFFAKVHDDGSVDIDGTAPGVMEREIAYARQAGLDYWAFVAYAEGDSMSLGIEQYLKSPQRSQVRFCLVSEAARWNDAAYVKRLVRLMSEKSYQTVAEGRPLLYLGFLNESLVKGGFRKTLDDFRSSMVAAGLKRPHIVIMGFDASQSNRWMSELACDAISAYATQANGTGAPYADLARHAEGFWESCRKTGASVVPIAMAGWDRRPRVEHPVPWETWQKPGEGLDLFYQTPSPEELAAHIRKAAAWAREHREQCPAQTVITYAWNENDEGGWLVPTLDEGPERVLVIGRAIGGK